MTRDDQLSLTDLIASAVAQHGGLKVLKAALLAALRLPTKPTEAAELPNVLRRDVGLPDRPPERPIPELLR